MQKKKIKSSFDPKRFSFEQILPRLPHKRRKLLQNHSREVGSAFTAVKALPPVSLLYMLYLFPLTISVPKLNKLRQLEVNVLNYKMYSVIYRKIYSVSTS